MSHIPQVKTGLKPPTKVHKPIQGGGGSATSPTGIVKPRGNPAPRPLSTPGAVKTTPSAGKSTTGSGVVRPRGSVNNVGGIASPRGSVHATSSQQLLPKLSRENSETRLSYRREGSSSSLRSTGSESSESVVRRRSSSSSSSQQGATPAADLKKFFKIGDRVLVSGTKTGVIGFIGETKFAKGDWAGIILDEPTGKNDGSVAGVRYFECQPLHGVFTKLEKITKINKVNVTHHNDDSTTALEIGDRVVVSGTKIGTVRYAGTTGFAKGEWAGVELDEPLGKNDGAVAGTRYFQCEQDFGLFAPIHKVIKTGKKESTKLPCSPPPTQKEQPLSIPPQLQESVLNSVNETPQGQAKTDKSVVSPESTSLSLSSSSTSTAGGQKREVESQDQPDVSPGKAPAHVSLQLLALQEALQEREMQIQALLEERDFERNEVASATSQVSKAEEELANIKKKHEQAAADNAKSIQELKNLVDLAEKEKADLYLQIEDEKRKNEDLQFKLEEEEITLGDELKTEEEQIKSLTQDLQEKQDEMKKLTEQLEQTKVEKSSTTMKLQEKEHKLLESNQQLSVLKASFEESQMKVQELEAKIFSVEEKHSAVSSEASQGMKEQLERIKKLEKELSLSNEREKQYQTRIENTKYELKIAMEENDSLKLQIENLTAKLISKENEFDSMSDELKQIKSATLELQKQLQISEAKTMNLASDKTKLECEIAELMKNSGSNSERLTYLNDQLREKDRILDELKGASAESQIQIARLTESVAEAKECHSKDLEKLGKSHDEQTKKLINQINSLKTDLEKQKDENARLVQTHKQELEELNNAQQTEVNTYKTKLNENRTLLEKLTKELEETKLQLQNTTQDRDVIKEKCSQYETEIQAKQNEISQVTSKLDAAVSEKSLLTSAQGDTEKKISEVIEKYEKLNSDYQAVLQEKNEKTKMCEENEHQVKTLNQEKEAILQEKQNTLSKLDELQAQYSALKKEMDTLKTHSTQKEEELLLLKSSASDKVSESTELQSQLDQVKSERDQFKRKVVVLEEQSNLLQEQIKYLGNEKTAIESQKDEMVDALAKAQDEIISLNARVQERPASLASEIPSLGMENDLEVTKHELKLKEEQLAKYKQQVLDVKKQMAASMASNNAGGGSQETADLAVKLVETEDLLEATTAEKENLDAQVEFLNSVIVDLQRKNEENEQRIELLMMGDTRPNGLLDSPELDEAPIPRSKIRLFCDICDVFDEHDTDDCPAQASEAPDVGSMHHGSRTEPRPYCTTCEVFGHWTEDCDDEVTF